MSEYSKAFLENTRKHWEPYYEHPLTEEDAREIIENMIGLFNLLNKLDEKYADKKEKNLQQQAI